MALATVGWALPHQLPVRRMTLPDLPINVSTEPSSSQMTDPNWGQFASPARIMMVVEFIKTSLDH